MSGTVSSGIVCFLFLFVLTGTPVSGYDNSGFSAKHSAQRAEKCMGLNLHLRAPQLTPVSQAIELARTCQGKIAITVHDQTMLRQLRMTLRYADCLDDTIIIGLGLVEAARVASANPDLHIMGELPNLPSEVDALVNAAQTTGLFGLRAEPKDLSERLVSACRQAGLFTMSRCTDDPNTLAELIRKGVNFIETRRPDITAALLPAGEAEPHGIPLRY